MIQLNQIVESFATQKLNRENFIEFTVRRKKSSTSEKISRKKWIVIQIKLDDNNWSFSLNSRTTEHFI